MLEVGRPRSPKAGSELRPGVRDAHVNNAYCLDPRPWRLDAKEARRLSGLDAPPKLLLGGQEQVLVERIRCDRGRDPLPTAGGDRECTAGIVFIDENGRAPASAFEGEL
jgi:hypothetical protein